jgi:cell division protein FtsI (penicillin-binding protein 3)
MPRKLYRHSRRPAARVIKAESRAHKLHEQNRARLMTRLVLTFCCFAVLALRLVEVGMIGGGELPFKRLVSQPELLLKMEDRGVRSVAVSAEFPRRTIVDRNGMLLAANIPTADLAANPKLIENPQQTAQQLARLLQGVSAETLAKNLNKKSSFTYIKRQITPAEQQAVHGLGIPGLFFENGMQRVYPAGALTSHLLGYVDVDNKGIAGIERSFDSRLRFTAGDNTPLKLSVDLRVQSLLNQELSGAMKEFSAIGAAGLVMDVRSGELIAMSSLPSFDPHDAGHADDDAKFNRITLGTYELGSTFKTFTLAMALERGAITIRDGYDTSYPVRESGFHIADYKPFYRWLSVPEIFAYSSNVGTVKMLQDVGFKAQTDFFKKLGLMQPASLELPEKGMPQLPAKWQPLNHMTASYGHGISVTPLHLARAMSAMVNGGRIPDLTLLKRDRDEQAQGARIIKEQTSKDVREMMRLVVDYGTARKAQVAGYKVGGKTGTAEKIVNGRYHDDKKITSFISAFPIDDPQYLIFVMVDEPKGTKATYGYATGGWVAAPVAARLTERIGPMLGVAPHFEVKDEREAEYWAASRRRNDEARQNWHRRGRGGVQNAAF